jgi:hypothetical protein
MAWTAPADKTTGDVVTAAIWNAALGATGNMSQTAPAKVTTAGDMVYATGANTLTRLGIGTEGYVLSVVSGVPGWVAGSALSLVASNSTAQSTTSTSAIDLLTLTPSASIGINDWAMLRFEYRKTATAAQAVSFGLKVNATIHIECGSTAGTGIARTSAANAVESGYCEVLIPPRSTANYGYAATRRFSTFNNSSPSVTVSSTYIDIAAATAPAGITGTLPNAAITSVTIRAQNHTSNNNAEVKNAALYLIKGV